MVGAPAGKPNARVLLVELGDVQAAVARLLLARGHSVEVHKPADGNKPPWPDETYDVVVARWPGAGRSGLASWAASECKGAYILTVVDDGSPTVVEALLAAGTNDVIASSALETLLEERVLVLERAILQRATRKKSEEITVDDVGTYGNQQDALRTLAEHLTTTLNSIGDGVIECEPSGMVTRMNPAAERLTGWGFAEAKGRPLDDIFKIVDGVTRSAIESPAARALRRGAVVAIGTHSMLVRPNGTELPVADSCAPIKGADGVVRGAVLVFRDVSVEHRARDLEEQNRRQTFITERMASVGALAAGAAHEINNPLGYVISNLDIALEELRAERERRGAWRPSELEEMLREARGGAERVRAVARNLKTLSRHEDERRSIVELRPLLELAANMTANEIRHRARLVEHFGAVPLVEVDGARLGQVFVNLLVNAAQALPDGHREQNEIRILTSTDAAGRAIIEIEDTGPGIPPAILNRIFDPFFTTKPVGVGTGLGLSISQNIVRSMGGEISARSEEGKGATFRVVLPAAEVQAASRQVEASRREVDRVADVLVVDDELALGMSLRRVLRMHRVEVMTRARDALDLLATGKTFDVIFSDLMMPDMSGMDFHEESLRRFPEAADRMIFITGGAFTPTAASFLARVPNERLEKPFDPETVRALVRLVGEKRKGPAHSGTVELHPKPVALPVETKKRPARG